MRSGRTVDSSFTPASNTNNDRSAEYWSGVGLPTSFSTFSMPFSLRVALPAISGGKIDPLHLDRPRVFQQLVFGRATAVSHPTA